MYKEPISCIKGRYRNTPKIHKVDSSKNIKLDKYYSIVAGIFILSMLAAGFVIQIIR